MTVTLTRVFNNGLFECSLKCSLFQWDLSFARVCHSYMISTQLHFIQRENAVFIACANYSKQPISVPISQSK